MASREQSRGVSPAGAAETLLVMARSRILQRDPDSFVNLIGGFTPFLPSTTPGDFTFADLITFAGANRV